MFGIYDFIMGYYCRLMATETIKIIDEMNIKNKPERVVGDCSNIYQLSKYIEKVVLKVEGIRSI